MSFEKIETITLIWDEKDFCQKIPGNFCENIHKKLKMQDYNYFINA